MLFEEILESRMRDIWILGSFFIFMDIRLAIDAMELVEPKQSSQQPANKLG